MDNVAIRTAAERIWQLWSLGDTLAHLPPELSPSSRAEGYAIQADLDRLSRESRVGWKIAATSAAGQKHIGVSGPIAGRIFRARVHAAGATVSIAKNRMRVAEPEFAFRFARSLAARDDPYSVDEVLAAVESLHLALELPDSRFDDFAAVGEATLIADNACAHDLILGAAVTADWRPFDLSDFAVSATVARRYERAGNARNVLGDPRLALTWIANELSDLGIGIAAGEFVTTGTSVPPLEIIPGDQVRADFGVLGSISATIAAG
ncbi:MAG TPA: hydratase [Hyphomicrobiaceae bacterium]|nr:hydratase [Hyphomicrobiaceae bacterium]